MFKKLLDKRRAQRELMEWAGALEAVTGVPRERIAADQAALWKEHLITRKEYAEFRLCSAPAALHDNFLGLYEQRPYLDYLNPKRYYILARNKFLAHLLFSLSGIAEAEHICFYYPENRTLTALPIVRDQSGVLRALQAHGAGRFVVKSAEGTHGHGIQVFDGFRQTGDDAVLHATDGSEIKLSELLGQEPLVFEKAIVQTPQFAAFNPTSVNTVRFMTTLYPDGSARVIATFIKIGRKGRYVDNAGEGGNVDACVNVETGRISFALQYDGMDNIQEIERHPDSGVLLKGVQIEHWEEIKAAVCRFQQAFPYCKAAGWDVAITESGPVIVEINDFWDRTGQLFIQRGWRKEIRDCYLAWKATGKEWRFGRADNRIPEETIQQVINGHA